MTSARYDVRASSARLFESSYETVAHRMCNLSDPRRRGAPMHFLRVDVAGNISKRYSGDGIRFPHQDGSCPKMAVHLAFLTPSVITKQYSAFPDGSTYFCFAKVVSEPQRGSLVKGTTYSIGLGTHADNAKHFAYADDLPFADPKKMAVPVRNDLPVLRAHRLQHAFGSELQVRVPRRRVHQEGQLLFAPGERRPRRGGAEAGSP